MKPLKIIAANLFLIASISGNAQITQPEDIDYPYNTLSYGVKGGFSYATATKGTASVAPDSRLGFYVGGYAEIPLVDELLSFQGELLYSAQGFERFYKVGDEDLTAEYHLDYINVPLLAKYYLVRGFSLEVGPQFGFLINDKISVPFPTEETPIPKETNKYDFSVVAGTSFKFDSGLFISFRYTHGFSDAIKEIKAKNTTFQLGLGYEF